MAAESWSIVAVPESGLLPKPTATGAPSLNLATTQADSAIVVANADWFALDGSSRTWRTGAGPPTELSYARGSASYTVYAARHANAGAAGSKTVGLSAPGGQKYSLAAVEIKGSSPAPPTASFTVSDATPYVGQEVTFDATGTCAAAPCTYTWQDDADNNAPLDDPWPIGSGDPLAFTFQGQGTKYVVLTVTDNLGRTAVARQGSGGTNVVVGPAPVCDDGQDNDGDGPTDYPADPGCVDPEDEDEFNASDEPVEAIWTAPTGAVTGSPVTLDGTDSTGDAPLSCVWQFENADGTIVWETENGCTIQKTFQNADTKYVRLIVTDADSDTDENLQSFIVGSPPQTTQCNDGVDNSDPEDTLVDLADPGCSSSSDNDETDPPPAATQCSDGVDNADPEDTLIDLADPGCVNSADDDETNAPPGGSCTHNATTSNFASVFAGAAGGSVICLASGNYGQFTGGSKSSTVTIRPQTGASPVMHLWLYPDTNNIRLEGLTIQGGYINAATNVTVINDPITDYLRVDAPTAASGATSGATSGSCSTA
jgi:hypothetical protein